MKASTLIKRVSTFIQAIKHPIASYEEATECRINHYGTFVGGEPIRVDEWCCGRHSSGCGKPVSSTFKFCPYCGVELLKEEHYGELIEEALNVE